MIPSCFPARVSSLLLLNVMLNLFFLSHARNKTKSSFCWEWVQLDLYLAGTSSSVTVVIILEHLPVRKWFLLNSIWLSPQKENSAPGRFITIWYVRDWQQLMHIGLMLSYSSSENETPLKKIKNKECSKHSLLSTHIRCLLNSAYCL